MSAISVNRPAMSLPLLIGAGAILAALGFGVRSSFGLFTLPVTADLGITRETFALAIAIQNLAWGLAQPFAGGFADRYGSGRTLAAGGIVYAAGMALMSVSTNGPMLYLSAGLICGVGIALGSFGVVMAAFGRAVPPEKRSFVFGLATAASSAGQFIFAPLGQAFIGNFGWQAAALYMGMMLLVFVPLALPLRGRSESMAGGADMPFMQALGKAMGHGSYRLLVLGFFVCGFHLAFITVHMPAYLVQCGLSPELGSWAIAVIGLFNIVGSLLSGYLGGRLPKQLLLSGIYFSRAVAIGLFMLLPVTPASALVFSAVIGVLWLSTVPLTAGLVSLFFGARYMGMLYGVAFLSHQIGSFVGVWLGGAVFDSTGSYSLVWYLGVLLGLASAAVHLPIAERQDPSFAPRLA